MIQNKQKYLLPLIFTGIMFFAIGFALGINSYLVPLLTNVLHITSGQSYLVIAATFSAFLLFGYPASMLIARIGYKKTMALSFLMFAVGFYLFIPSANSGSLLLFLLASFISGMGNTFLQASVNPYITILGPIESAAKRISIMGICNKLAWPVSPIFLAVVIGKNVDQVQLTDIKLPFIIIIGVFLLLGGLVLLAPMPEVKAVGEDENSVSKCPYAAHKTSIWQFPHLLLGCLALFLYVGVETLALATTVDYATSLGFTDPQDYAIYPSIGLVIGYICGILFIPKLLRQETALKICSWLAVFSSLGIVLTPPAISIWFVAMIGLACSLMWPALWPLAMADLGRFTKKGASLLVIAIVGGAVIPAFFGLLKDTIGAQNAYWLCVPCFLYILYYAMIGYKVRTDTRSS